MATYTITITDEPVTRPPELPEGAPNIEMASVRCERQPPMTDDEPMTAADELAGFLMTGVELHLKFRGAWHKVIHLDDDGNPISEDEEVTEPAT